MHVRACSLTLNPVPDLTDIRHLVPSRSIIMFKPLASSTLAALSLFMLSVNESQACCFLDCFHCCKPAAPPPTYCPAPAPTCDVCPQQVNYVPQTCCSPISAPVTTFRPVATPLNYAPACSTCSGAAYSSPYY